MYLDLFPQSPPIKQTQLAYLQHNDDMETQKQAHQVCGFLADLGTP